MSNDLALPPSDQLAVFNRLLRDGDAAIVEFELLSMLAGGRRCLIIEHRGYFCQYHRCLLLMSLFRAPLTLILSLAGLITA